MTTPTCIRESCRRLDEMEHRAMRALADLGNVRKRFDRELERHRADDKAKILAHWLQMADALERAVEHAEGPALAGLRALSGQCRQLLARQGVAPIRARGVPFDPAWHEVVGTEETTDAVEDLVVDVLETGYTLDGALLRPARVIVAKRRETQGEVG